jgi:hypothetical protein
MVMSESRGNRLLMAIIAWAGLLAIVTDAGAAQTEIYRFTNETGGPAPSITLRFAGVDSSLTVGLVLGVQHPLIDCTVGKTDREITYPEGNTEVFLTWPGSPLCAGGMIKVQVTSENRVPEFLGGQWLADNGAPLAAATAFQGCDIAVWASLNLQMQSLVAWISNTGTTDLANVRCIVENDPERSANFLFAGQTVFEGENLALPFHKSSGTICPLDHEQRTADYGAIRLSAIIPSSDCKIEPAKLVAEICVAWDGDEFEIISCDHNP